MVELDNLDFAILQQLQEDGRKSFTDIADVLNVSIGTIRTRTTRLLEDKTLQVIGRVDTNKVGFGAYAHIAITVKSIDLIEEVIEALSRFTEISFMAEVSGEYDLEMNVMCIDNQHLSNLISQIRKVNGVLKTETSLYLKVIKYAQPDLNIVRKLEE